MHALRSWLKRLLTDVFTWGPGHRARSLPDRQDNDVLDSHWRNG